MKIWLQRCLLLLASVCIAGLPRSALAACGVQDLGACVDAAQYTFWFGLASFGWSLDRTLLLLSYQLEVFRWWLVEVAFTSAYGVLTGLIDPLIVPFASVAIILGCLALLLVPIFGRIELVKLRHAMAWVVLAPMVLTISGPLIVQTEQIRSQVGLALFNGVSVIAPGAIFGSPASDMAPVQPLLPANPCGTPLARPGGATGLRIDDTVAALTWSTMGDIQCAELQGPGIDVPDGFYEAAPNGPGYATAQAVGEMLNAAQRAAAVDAIQRGAIRTFLALLPALLAVLDSLVQLIFALCLIALWIGLPIGLLFVFFQQSSGPVTGLLRRAIGVLQVSWSSSVVLGMLFACLLAAAELRNAAAYTGFALGALLLTASMLTIAVDTLKSCLRTLSDNIAVATGINPLGVVQQAQQLTSAAASVGAAAFTGGAGMALAGAVANRQTGSGRYAAGAILGQFAPLAKVGEIAAAMGEGGELVSGLVAGGRGQRGGVRALATLSAADAHRTDAHGRTFRDHAKERRIERSIHRPPSIIEELGSAARTISTTAVAAQNGTLATTLLQRGQQVGTTLHDRLGKVGDTWQQFTQDVDAQSGPGPNLTERAVATAAVLDQRLTRRGQAMQFDPRACRVVWSQRVAALPPDTLTLPRDQVRLPRLLTLGYTAQENDDGTLSVWQAQPSAAAPSGAGQSQPTRPPATPPPPATLQIAQANQRLTLAEAGALLADPAALRAEIAKLQQSSNGQDGQG
jgi:hypothetical protein